MFLSIVLMFTSFTSTYAAENSSETDLQSKISLYKLGMIADSLNSGDNDIIYHWIDKDGISKSVDLVVTFNKEDGNISSVKEKNTSSMDEIYAIKTSIEEKDSSAFNTFALPEAKYKLNGGETRSQYANDHAYGKHKYETGSSSSCSRSRYAQHVDVKDLRSTTVAQPDEKINQRQADNTWRTFFIKQYVGRSISMNMSDYGYTYYHRVIKNGTLEETHHPYCF